MILNRTDVRGEIANPVAALIACLAVNAVIFGAGLQQRAGGATLAFEPPGWAVGAIWLAIFPMWGMARWHALRAGRGGRKLASFIVVMMVWSLLYPLLSAGFDLYRSAALNAVSLVIVGAALLRARKVSASAWWWIAPSMGWVVFANALTLAKIAAS